MHAERRGPPAGRVHELVGRHRPSVMLHAVPRRRAVLVLVRWLLMAMPLNRHHSRGHRPHRQGTRGHRARGNLKPLRLPVRRRHGRWGLGGSHGERLHGGAVRAGGRVRGPTPLPHGLR